VPKTYLVPEKERTKPPSVVWYGWVLELFKVTDNDIIAKCGLDAYFFLRYLFTLLKIFIPLACVIWPILLPLNFIDGNHAQFDRNVTGISDVSGLDTLAWSNVAPNHTSRYWAHLILAIVVVVWVCFIFFNELRGYIRVRQAYLTSPQHRLRASATTVLVTAIPKKWMTVEALDGLYDVFPGGIRNIWINRNFDDLSEKVHKAQEAALELEAAETKLIRLAKKNQLEKKKKDEKKARKEAGRKKQTKEELAQEQAEADAKAQQVAAGQGVSSGDRHEVRHTVDDALDEEDKDPEAHDGSDHEDEHPEHHDMFGGVPIFGKGLKTFGQGIGQGVGIMGAGVGKAGKTLFGGVKHVGDDIDNQIETTNGFQQIDDNRFSMNGLSNGAPLNLHRTFSPEEEQEGLGVHRSKSSRVGPLHPAYKAAAPKVYLPSQGRDQFNTAPRISDAEVMQHEMEHHPDTFVHGTGMDGTGNAKKSSDRWKFWQAPKGAFPSPIPNGFEDEDFPFAKDGQEGDSDGDKKGLAKIKNKLPFFHDDEEKPQEEYPVAFDEELDNDKGGDGEPVWKKYVEEKDRPTFRLPLFSWTPEWLPGVGWLGLGKKVDTIYYYRKQLATLNVEIEEDQQHPEKFPLMNSAFIQFNHQVAAHMACQSVSHHVPKQMAPRTIEISPNDVLWDNMSIKWWEAWLRTGAVFAMVTGMVIFWAIPVTWSASLSSISTLIRKYQWLSFLNQVPVNVIKVLQGILPAAVLAILLAIVPLILRLLARVQGNQTGMAAELSVQNYYFSFLFVQVFLVVSIASSVFQVLGNISDITSVPNTLAENLPKASNYFFSYMLLQALSTSAGALLQVVTLIKWYLFPKILDNTARSKWKRQTELPSVKWGSFFPVYTNFACIALVYSVVSPLILLFAIITFTLFWVAYRYNTLYVSRFELDTGGLLFPRAINQTFTGLYVMELCLIGLFLLVRDTDNKVACSVQAIIMIVVAILTGLFQILLNQAFGPLFRYLPITLEDDAVRRDRDFERLQAKRLGLDYDPDEHEDSDGTRTRTNSAYEQHSAAAAQLDGNTESIELHNIDPSPDRSGRQVVGLKRLDPRNVITGKSWAHHDKSSRSKNFGHYPQPGRPHMPHRRSRPSNNRQSHNSDLEAQKHLDSIGAALYGNMADEIEDLTPDERDLLVQRAFQHSALRAPRPAVWIPRDDLGVSDDEVMRTRAFTKQVWVTNEGTALDGSCRVVYGRNPPDFSEVDLIQL
jgi:hypothetical protein